MSAPFEKLLKVICSPHGAGRFIVEIVPASQNCGTERKQQEFIEDAIREKLERERSQVSGQQKEKP